MSEKRFNVGDVHELTIDRLAVGGRGVGRLDGLVVFVSDVAPQELVEVELTHVKKNFAEAQLVRVVRPSDSRVIPPCRYFGTCGGCDWQQVSYPEQLKQKRGFVVDAIRKFSKFNITDEQILSTVASPNEWRYRNRIQLHHRTSSSGASLLGFHGRASHQLVDIEDCLITETALTERLGTLRKKLKDAPAGRVEIYTSEDGEVQTRDTFSDTQMNDTSEQKKNTTPTRNLPGARSAGPVQRPAAAPQPPPFSQVNTLQNTHLIQHCIEQIKSHSTPSDHPHLLDLYSGHGNFTFPLANEFPAAQITAVELNADSVKLGYQLTKTRRLAWRVKFVAADVAEFLSRPKEENLDAPIVLLDPPRSGCDVEVIRSISALKPQLIVYVSCHPVTMARDLGVFFDLTTQMRTDADDQTSDYELLQVTPFDMFPQTDHVESVAVLRRRSDP